MNPQAARDFLMMTLRTLWLCYRKPKGRGVSYMTYDLKQAVFSKSVETNDMKTMERLVDLSNKQITRNPRVK